MIFIKTDGNNRVSYQHNMPMHSRFGLKKTEAELLAEGYLVSSVPEFEEIDGKSKVLYYTEAEGFTCEYIDLPKSTEEKLTEAENKIILMQQALDELLLGGM